MNSIDQRSKNLKQIFQRLQETPLTALRQILTDDLILEACTEVGHEFRMRKFGPIVTVFHFLLQAIGRDKSFAGTWQTLWSNVLTEFGVEEYNFNSSAICQARSRLPKEVLDFLVRQFQVVDKSRFSMWCDLRLLALDSTTVSMPREKELFDYFGAHKARSTIVRYPLATFCSLISVGTSLILDHGFGPFDPGELKTATPLLDNLGKGDLLLADRRFSGSTTLAYVSRQTADFLMRKNGRLIVKNLPVLERLGQYDFITEIPMSKPARKKDPSLPEKVRTRIFKATWKTPAGETVTEWFVTSLEDSKRFPKKTLAKLYHERWQIETSFEEFKVWFHADVLRSKTVDNIQKEFTAHLLGYQLVRLLILEAAKKHGKKPTEISFLNAARWVVSFSSLMSAAFPARLPEMYTRLLDAIASTEIAIRPGRLEPRMISREKKHYPRLKIPRSQWRKQRRKENAESLS